MSRYVATDWHGNLRAAQKVLNELMGPEDKLYYLGDCADRGQDGLAVFDLLTSDPRVTFIKGNHEYFLQEGIERWVKYARPALSNLWEINGGEATAAAVERSSDEENFKRLAILKKMPYTVTVSVGDKIVILDHCGYTPKWKEGHNRVKELVSADPGWEPMWDRFHFRDAWPEEKDLANVYVVHGHTPTQYLLYRYFAEGVQDIFPNDKRDFKDEPVIYADGHKIDLDVVTWYTNKVAVFDLDTMKIITLEV